MDKKMHGDHETHVVPSDNLFPVIGVGASAGGLEAFKKFISAIPEKSGMAFVLVQHLDPNHDSILASLLQKDTPIPVVEIFDEIKVQSDHIYIIPSNKILMANDGVLEIADRPPNEKHLPIDLFFSSLAEVHQSHAIGVVLSGTARDGTAGLKSIKEHGGLTFAQDENSAAYSEMPYNAVLAGVVDFILQPQDIPAKILDIVGFTSRSGSPEHESADRNDIFKEIISLLHVRTGTDFSYYKQSTVRRRILRRMVICKSDSLETYLKSLRQSKSEEDKLYQDLLIPVTGFFRDTPVFQKLCESIFPPLVSAKDSAEPIRVWIAGCSTGEEAYSIAICLKEYLDENQFVNVYGNDQKIQIFATDISGPAIAKARTGTYTKSEAQGISSQRLKLFFTKHNGGYIVSKAIREMCVFAVHNFLKDPPFGKMDLISCRNVLIYMEPYLQKKALVTFHYALVPKGFLFLGRSENTSGVPDLFTVIDRTGKLFSRKDVPGKITIPITNRKERALRDSDSYPKSETLLTDFRKAADDILLSRFTPAGVVINSAMDIVHFRGKTAAFLEQSAGKPSHNLLKMARGGLSFELLRLLRKVRKNNESALKEKISLEIDGRQHACSIEAIPLANIVDEHYLILFHDCGIMAGRARESKEQVEGKSSIVDSNEASAGYIHQLETELAQIREDMRGITGDQEAANQDLQSANEELLSNSEELQTLNEELETSKEELQATIEELTVVNQEMVTLNDRVAASRDYAEGIIATIREPLLVLDSTLRIKSANRSFYKTFQVNNLEIEGKSIYDIGHGQWNIPSLRNVLEEIIPWHKSFVDFEVAHIFQHIGHRTMRLNAREIKGADGGESLILLAIEDITDEASSRLNELALLEELKQSELHFRLLADLMPAKISNANSDGEVIYLSKAWTDFTGVSFEELRDFGYHNIMHPDEIEQFQRLLHHAGKTGTVLEMEMRFKNKTGDYIWHLNRASPVKDDSGNLKMWVGVTADISDQVTIRNRNLEQYTNQSKELEEKVQLRTRQLVTSNEALEEKNRELERTNQDLNTFTYVSSHDLQEPLRKIQMFINLLLDHEDESLSSKGKEHFNRIRSSAERMQSLLRDLLAFARISSVDRKFERIELEDILKQVISDMKEEIEEKNALIETGKLCSISVIPFQFRQLLTNLIGNSLKFSKKNTTPHIVVEGISVIGTRDNLHRLNEGREYCHITVRDNGIGFSPRYARDIFDLFKRLHTKSEYDGTGMGLFIVRKVVEIHHGEVFASGETNEGAIFNIFIPTHHAYAK